MVDRKLRIGHTVETQLLDDYPFFPNCLELQREDYKNFGKNLFMVHGQRCNERFKLFGVPLPAFFAKELADDFMDRLLETAMEFSGILQAAVTSRRIIMIIRGYLGMASKASEQGDSIFLLKGCNMPLVLRPYGDGTYHLVGECYVHGIMDGEAMDQSLKDDPDEEMDIVLR